jgi:putative ABC transport system permease protein
VTQVLAESTAVGLVGAAVGVAVAWAGTSLVDAVTPTLTAIVDRSRTITVHLDAHTDPRTIATAVLIALGAALAAVRLPHGAPPGWDQPWR